MKSIRKDQILKKNLVESTKREKDILLKVDHPFLVGMRFIIDSPQHVFFVMDFLRGGELWQLLNESVKLRIPENHAKFYALNIAIAIGYLHSQKIMYRDLKPDNVLIDEFGYLRVADFGLSKFHEHNELTHSVLGTPDYIAPEILKN